MDLTNGIAIAIATASQGQRKRLLLTYTKYYKEKYKDITQFLHNLSVVKFPNFFKANFHYSITKARR